MLAGSVLLMSYIYITLFNVLLLVGKVTVTKTKEPKYHGTHH